MEINVVESTKNKLVIELKGEDHTFCNILVKELQKDSNVKAAAYKIEHPLRRVPKVMIETTSGSPKDALLKAAANLVKDAGKLEKEFAKEI
ncbi:DNA-directed RNA polymerase subunit L [Candidatus Woesearchaeota archaeon]|nr:DNA-directed RNA polymerase subunit L [Candidatus Woesearchaeota archaeon]MBW3018354.1 DNA-directed RNA polymerase subunit L [Candidatus Woesearchaeota archaeon]